ncbi:MAG: DUF2723 domain-containing protein [Bacteroidales bacterium]|nr:DUF2723 domain-containing protein [Bacteroidales bacterium]
MEQLFRKVNNITGWSVFSIAAFVYISTSEPTTSFWDCGEYISTAYKLQVGHPPGAPFFQLLGRFFSMFAFGDTTQVAYMVNILSALSGSFTILFLFWSITLLARKIADRSGEMTREKIFAIAGSGVVGALAYTFSDSFWFSAVEGEVYAMSSFFTALVFWSILKWERVAGEPGSDRWLIFIAYLMGLSIGVHLLNLLAIPAITLVYFFRKYKNPHWRSILITLVISFLILAFIMYGIIPWVVKMAGNFELFFVNAMGLPFNTGTVIYFAALTGVIIWLLRYARKLGKSLLHTIVIAIVFLLIGYSSFFMLIIRSNANPPIDENSPEDAIALLAYLNREQYGDWPLLYGPYYNAPITGRKDGRPVYRKDPEKERYVVIDHRKDVLPVYDPAFLTFFPRMWNNQESRYINDYKKWGKVTGIPVTSTDEYGETETLDKPTFSENLRYFFRYQLGHMYFRYFMWNFAGRQNDIQGMSDRRDGNWITGIPFIDSTRLGTDEPVPESMRNKAYNRFFLLPLLLGLTGLCFHYRKHPKDTLVVTMLFIMTGIAIVIYLNQHAPQPRERDYAYAASFYAFAIWIGLGVMALNDMSRKYFQSTLTPVAVTLLCLLLVPFVMAREGWDDHDRSGRYVALAVAKNYLNSCAPNAILFTNGDNDTFPLWYAQEVEGIRTDVRVVNLSLLNTDWYIDQMTRKAYDSDPLPFSLTHKQYRDGTRDLTYLIENENIRDHVDLEELFRIIHTDESKLRVRTRYGDLDYFPTKKFRFPVDPATVLANGTVASELADKVVDEIRWTINSTAIGKNHLMVLDLLAHNHWERPVHFAITTGSDAYIGLEEYFQLEGLTYRLVPIKSAKAGGQTGRVATEVMYDIVMNRYEFGNMHDPSVYLDETIVRMTMNLRNNFYRLAIALVEEERHDSAVMVMNRCLEVIPEETVPYNIFMVPMAEVYFEAGAPEKGSALALRMTEVFADELGYFFSFKGSKSGLYNYEKQQHLAMLQRIMDIADTWNDPELGDRAQAAFEVYYRMYREE